MVELHVNLVINTLGSRTDYTSRLKKAKEAEKRETILLFMIRGMLSAYRKRKRYLLHFEFQN